MRSSVSVSDSRSGTEPATCRSSSASMIVRYPAMSIGKSKMASRTATFPPAPWPFVLNRPSARGVRRPTCEGAARSLWRFGAAARGAIGRLGDRRGPASTGPAARPMRALRVSDGRAARDDRRGRRATTLPGGGDDGRIHGDARRSAGHRRGPMRTTVAGPSRATVREPPSSRSPGGDDPGAITSRRARSHLRRPAPPPRGSRSRYRPASSSPARRAPRRTPARARSGGRSATRR